MEATPQDEQVHKQRSWVATIVTVAVLVLLIVFVWRVLYFADLIQTGEINVDDYNFVESYTTSLALSSAPITNGTFDVTSTDDPTLGNPNAPVVIVEFADFNCPFSRQAATTLRSLASRYPDEIYYIYRDFPISELHPFAQRAAEAGNCADEQGKFWEYHDKLYQNQDDLDEGELVLLAEQLNLDVNAFTSCLSSNRYTDEVLEDYQDGLDAGVRGTPTFFINGNRIPGAIPEQILEAIVDSVVRYGD